MDMGYHDKNDEKSKGIEDILHSLGQTQPGSHSIVVYPNLVTFRQIYSNYTNQELRNNRIVLILPHYETVQSVENFLLLANVNVEKYQQQGVLSIIDGNEAFFNHPDIDYNTDYDARTNNEKGNIVSLMRIMQAQAVKLGKDGITIILDLGCFFTQSLYDLMSYEKSIPLIFKNTTLKQLCMYHQRDFDERFTNSEQASLLDQHARSIIMVDN
jgi:hypothetical protein